MNITVYVVTYKNDIILNEWLLASLAESRYPKGKVRLHIQNNFSGMVAIDEPYRSLIDHIHHNTVRLDRSLGHLARDWNHGIMHGFVDLKNPRSDMVMLLQNDTKLTSDWYEKVCGVMRGNYFASYGAGDQCVLIRPECIKKVGMFDERFCDIYLQEGDYFLRCIWRIPMHASINDDHHVRTHRPMPDSCPVVKTETGLQRREEYHTYSPEKKISAEFWNKKWPFYDRPWGSSWELAKSVSQSGSPLVPMHIMYPYFERDIDQSVYRQWSPFKLA